MKGSRMLFASTSFLAALFWLIALAGISALTERVTPRRYFLGIHWWELIAELFVLIWAARLQLKGIRRSRPAVLALLTYLTALLTLSTAHFFDMREEFYILMSHPRARFHLDQAFLDRVNVCTAGFLMLTLLNLLLIIIFGTVNDEEEIDEEEAAIANGAYGPIA